MSFNFDGMKEFQKSLEKAAKKSKNIEKEGIPLYDAFSPAFMSDCSKFESFDEFMSTGGFVKDKNGTYTFDEDELDSYVSENTCYDSFDEMFKEAMQTYVMDNIF